MQSQQDGAGALQAQWRQSWAQNFTNEVKKEEIDLTGMPVESNISKQLTEKTTKIVIVIILLNLFILPFFELNTFWQFTTPASLGFDMLVDFSIA